MPVEAIFRILRGNLHNVSMLAYIYVSNQNSADAELRFIMGSKDYGKLFFCDNLKLSDFSFTKKEFSVVLKLPVQLL